jgi:uncharacterized protein
MLSSGMISDLVRKILETYHLPWDGLHGVGHWARVYENGLRLARMTGAKVDIVQLFAVLHDSRRMNEGIDPGHGKRAADFARTLRVGYIDLEDGDFESLYEACADHTAGRMKGDITVCTCWDADRLDLARAGFSPRPERLCTPAAKDPAMIAWASQRSINDDIPHLVYLEWKVLNG